jgi:hypothetical protein
LTLQTFVPGAKSFVRTSIATNLDEGKFANEQARTDILLVFATDYWVSQQRDVLMPAKVPSF